MSVAGGVHRARASGVRAPGALSSLHLRRHTADTSRLTRPTDCGLLNRLAALADSTAASSTPPAHRAGPAGPPHGDRHPAPTHRPRFMDIGPSPVDGPPPGQRPSDHLPCAPRAHLPATAPRATSGPRALPAPGPRPLPGRTSQAPPHHRRQLTATPHPPTSPLHASNRPIGGVSNRPRVVQSISMSNQSRPLASTRGPGGVTP